MFSNILLGLLLAVAFKTITGYRFPWETCSCCGKRVSDHKE